MDCFCYVLDIVIFAMLLALFVFCACELYNHIKFRMACLWPIMTLLVIAAVIAAVGWTLYGNHPKWGLIVIFASIFLEVIVVIAVLLGLWRRSPRSARP